MFDGFSFFHTSLWGYVDKILQKLTKCYKSELRHLFECSILVPRKCLRKTPFQHTVRGALCFVKFFFEDMNADKSFLSMQKSQKRKKVHSKVETLLEQREVALLSSIKF